MWDLIVPGEVLPAAAMIDAFRGSTRWASAEAPARFSNGHSIQSIQNLQKKQGMPKEN
jgi:hypothetical protein